MKIIRIILMFLVPNLLFGMSLRVDAYKPDGLNIDSLYKERKYQKEIWFEFKSDTIHIQTDSRIVKLNVNIHEINVGDTIKYKRSYPPNYLKMLNTDSCCNFKIVGFEYLSAEDDSIRCQLRQIADKSKLCKKMVCQEIDTISLSKMDIHQIYFVNNGRGLFILLLSFGVVGILLSTVLKDD